MKVYPMTYTLHDWQRHGGSKPKLLATYGSEALAKDALAEHLRKSREADPQALKENGGHIVINEHEDGRGFTVGSTWGSMSFLPGSYSYTEEEVIEKLDG